LVNENVPSDNGFVMAMAAYPAIEQNAYFCGVDCLRTWLDTRYPPGKAPYHGGKRWAEYQRKQRAAGEPRQWK
jgi:hypothetical protein